MLMGKGTHWFRVAKFNAKNMVRLVGNGHPNYTGSELP